MEAEKTTDCPCGSGTSYETCCEPLILGVQQAQTAEQLMRSRYTAYTKAEIAYIQQTTHPSKRDEFDPEDAQKWAKESKWHGLEILTTEQGGSEDPTGVVIFLAHYTQKGKTYRHHERATFVKENDQWYFEDGEPYKAKPFVREAPKIGRNDPCSCGSGKKYKKCCMIQTGAES